MLVFELVAEGQTVWVDEQQPSLVAGQRVGQCVLVVGRVEEELERAAGQAAVAPTTKAVSEVTQLARQWADS